MLTHKLCTAVLWAEPNDKEAEVAAGARHIHCSEGFRSIHAHAEGQVVRGPVASGLELRLEPHEPQRVQAVHDGGANAAKLVLTCARLIYQIHVWLFDSRSSARKTGCGHNFMGDFRRAF